MGQQNVLHGRKWSFGGFCLKGGDLIGIIQGDVGIVYDEKGPYIVCIICNDPASFKGCAKKIADISRRISDCMTLCA